MNTNAAGADRFDVREKTIAQLQSVMQSGKLTSRQLVELYLTRIAALDRSGPKLNSVIELNPEALDIAASLDIERKAGGPRGPLQSAEAPPNAPGHP